MERRRLMAVAGALSATAFATTVALGANLGLFDMTQPDSGAGRLDGARTVVTTAEPNATPTATAVSNPTDGSEAPSTVQHDGHGADD